MFKEILKIIPKLDSAALRAMQNALQTRFTAVAKKFGKGMLNAIKGGGVAGIVLGLVDKFLNPLKEVQEALDRTLAQGDDIVTNAKQFGTTAGKLFKLQELGRSTGLDPDQLFTLINKFQTAVAEAEADKTKDTSVRAFVGEQDMAEAFFEFIQQLQKMDKNQQLLVQQEVFGEKQILKMADFLQTDFAKQINLIGAKGSEIYTPGLIKAADLKDLKDAFEARRNLDDSVTKGRIINEGMITSQDRIAKEELRRENARLASYQSLSSISENTNKIFALLEKGLLALADLLTNVKQMAALVKKLAPSRLLKGLFGGGDE
jgi:hypothetical protein